MANTSNNILSPITIYKEFTVLGCANTTGNSFIIAPSADLTDTLGLANNKWISGYFYGLYANTLALGNATVNSVGNSTVNSAANVGYTVLPGGVIMQWGSVTAGTPQTFPIPFPTNVFSFHVTGQTANVASATANSTKISVISTAGTPVSSYLVIGN